MQQHGLYVMQQRCQQGHMRTHSVRAVSACVTSDALISATHTHTHARMHARTHAHTKTRTHVCIQTDVYTNISTHVRSHPCMHHLHEACTSHSLQPSSPSSGACWTGQVPEVAPSPTLGSSLLRSLQPSPCSRLLTSPLLSSPLLPSPPLLSPSLPSPPSPHLTSFPVPSPR